MLSPLARKRRQGYAQEHTPAGGYFPLQHKALCERFMRRAYFFL
jgi:hypothetical protein